MRRLPLSFVVLLGGLLFIATGCASNPNVEGAKLDLRNKEYDSALENIDQALEENPKDAEALKLKGDILIEKAGTVSEREQHTDLIQRGIEAYEQALEINPELKDEVDRGKRLAYIKEFDAGAQAFKRGKKDESAYSEAATYFKNAAAIQPDSAGAYVNQAYALMNAGEQQAAIEPLQTAIQKGEDRAQNYTILAQLVMQEAEGEEGAEEAIAVLEEAQEKYPDNPDLQSLILNAYVRAGQMEQAMETYRAAVEREPENKLYRYNYGSLLLNDGQFDRAIEQLRRATEIDPSYADAHHNLGAAYVKKAVAANDSLRKLNEQFSQQSSELTQEQEQQMKELASQRESMFSEAIPPLQKARELIQQEGGDAQAVCRSLFQAYVQTGQEDKAKEVSECAGYEDKPTDQ